MRLLIGFDADIPDAVAEGLLRTAGVELAPADYPLALALALLGPFPSQLREFLLSPDHTPVPLNSWTLLTTERSAAKVGLMLSTPNEDSPVWNPQNKSQPASPSKPSRPRRPAKSASASRSNSKPRKPTGTS